MYKPKLTPISHDLSSTQLGQALPNPFRLLTWNLHKTDFAHYIHRPIEQLLSMEPPHLLSFQEAATRPMQNRFFNLPFVMAPNIETRQKHFGVLTATEFGMTAQHQCLTRSRELGWATHKTALVTEHCLQNGETLTHINIHAINFVPNRLFQQELNLLWHLIAEKSGPMIVSGDFNTWNKTRVAMLEKAVQQLGLSEVAYPDTRPIRTLNRQILDYVFYRGLTVQSARAFHVEEISDHNPLEVVFAL
ncbi:endonuclease/exonuclease/phosphatase family protein [Thiomicrospira sp. S5]|jgi:endonuclease/exonuclease/phosphatase (EEP) superfamily protein YafD|uniref:endonuclease/exonuclease/phosphatase family protein n=1 Tax=Thiomicrospira sp. S5 TaxID=1803865 RepID=UPI000F89FA5C|nr:endonuclease/exonuclease/phosphatase family protein [Thiomicrospira sp. S5]AZR82351.1 hypothetical protein AYJ59_08670 [Thiomicrospira sp. S5]